MLRWRELVAHVGHWMKNRASRGDSASMVMLLLLLAEAIMMTEARVRLQENAAAGVERGVGLEDHRELLIVWPQKGCLNEGIAELLPCLLLLEG